MAVAGARYESGWRGVINKVHTNSKSLPSSASHVRAYNISYLTLK